MHRSSRLSPPPPPHPPTHTTPPARLLPPFQVGGLLVDGLGDGAMVEAPSEDLDFLRTTAFGLLQASVDRV